MNTGRLLGLMVTISCVAFCRVGYGQAGLPGPGAEAGQPPATPVDPAVYRQQVGYMLGQNVGSDLRENGIDLDLESLIAGLTDAYTGKQPKWTDAQLEAARQKFTMDMRSRAMNRM